MERQDLLKLYEVSVDEEHRWTDSHQARVAFYAGLVTTILAVIGAGVSQANLWQHFVVLGIGSGVLTMIAQGAKEGTFREYQRLLSAIITRAKIEQELGLTEPLLGAGHNTIKRYWPDESLVSRRHFDSRKKHDTSELFMQENERGGYQKEIERLFHRFELLGLLMMLVCFAAATSKAISVVNGMEKPKISVQTKK